MLNSVSSVAGDRTVVPECSLADRLFETRRLSIELTKPLTAEDMVVQSMDDASPTKWHLAHVTWFFETFLLKPYLKGYRVFDQSFNYCFNSYYESQGARQPRSLRGLLTRPSIESVLAYRRHVDHALSALVQNPNPNGEVARIIEIGINHEQQHQELLLTDILSLFAANPLRPAYRDNSSRGTPSTVTSPLRWITFEGRIGECGAHPGTYCWDNELPRHQVLIHPFRLADRLVSNGEWLDFMRDGGYRTASLWLADGWSLINRLQWQNPLYWEYRDDAWCQMTLGGLLPVEMAAPVAHMSYYEADAFARWAGHRLPTEFEWEIATTNVPARGNTLGSGSLRPVAPAEDFADEPRQLFGDVWEWTQSAYLPYPGYRPPEGAIGEYNGKFMVNQQVLRGASCVTPDGHSRASYRNFFYPHQRWQFVGLRLASGIA